MLFRYAMSSAVFREIVQTKFSSVSTTAVVKKKIVPRRVSVRNHNRLLWNYDGALSAEKPVIPSPPKNASSARCSATARR